MPTIYVRLDPRELTNPDLDIRYVLPDFVTEKSGALFPTTDTTTWETSRT
jgi:hypothetical protein